VPSPAAAGFENNQTKSIGTFAMQKNFIINANIVPMVIAYLYYPN
jgi:hypothetical protein